MSKKEVLESLVSIANSMSDNKTISVEDDAIALWDVIQLIDKRYDMTPNIGVNHVEYDDANLEIEE